MLNAQCALEGSIAEQIKVVRTVTWPCILSATKPGTAFPSQNGRSKNKGKEGLTFAMTQMMSEK